MRWLAGLLCSIFLITSVSAGVRLDSAITGGGGGGSGDALTSNPLSQFAATTSLQLKNVLTDETGSQAAVFQLSPTLITPLLGTPTSGVMTNVTGTAAGLTAGSVTIPLSLGGGDVQFFNQTSTGTIGNWAKGTAASPDTALHPPFKVSRLIELTSGWSGDGGEQMAAIQGITKGTASNLVQPLGIYGGAATIGAYDAGGGYFVAVGSGASTGYAIGSFSAGQKMLTGNKGHGAEITFVNSSGVDDLFVAGGPQPSSALFISMQGSPASLLGKVSSAIEIGQAGQGATHSTFDVGLGFTSGDLGMGSVSGSSIRDVSQSLVSLDIQGTHTTAAIKVAVGSGDVLLGGTSVLAPLHVGAGTDTPTITRALGTNIYATNVGATAIVVRDSSADVEMFLYAGGGAGIFGSSTAHPFTIRSSNTDRISITAGGTVTVLSPTVYAIVAGTGTLAPAIVYTGAANTALTASTERFDVQWNSARTEQWATGALTLQRFHVWQAPTIGFVGASTVTDTCTVCITGAPVKGTNATLTQTAGLHIYPGAVSTAAASYGLIAEAPTGATVNYAGSFMGAPTRFQGEGTGFAYIGTTTVGGNYTGIGLNGVMSAANYSMMGGDGNLFFNTNGGSIYFRVTNGTKMEMGPTGALTITSTSAAALGIGANGATNPVFLVAANVASVATGVKITGAAAAGGVTLAAISSGTDEGLKIDAKGAGNISVGFGGTGQVLVSALKTTGAASGKTVVCVDIATGQLYASTSGVACSN